MKQSAFLTVVCTQIREASWFKKCIYWLCLCGSLKSFCLQVILALGDYMSVQCHCCIGGTNIGEDIRKLDYGQHVVSGTPGRVFGEPVVTFVMSFEKFCLLIS